MLSLAHDQQVDEFDEVGSKEVVGLCGRKRSTPVLLCRHGHIVGRRWVVVRREGGVGHASPDRF